MKRQTLLQNKDKTIYEKAKINDQFAQRILRENFWNDKKNLKSNTNKQQIVLKQEKKTWCKQDKIVINQIKL